MFHQIKKKITGKITEQNDVLRYKVTSVHIYKKYSIKSKNFKISQFLKIFTGQRLHFFFHKLQ